MNVELYTDALALSNIILNGTLLFYYYYYYYYYSNNSAKFLLGGTSDELHLEI
jgi:hypothetical protein